MHPGPSPTASPREVPTRAHRPGKPERRERPLLRTLASLCTVAALSTSCAGPTLQIDNSAQHAIFVDGRQEAGRELPFRYYGTTAVDALPADLPGTPTQPDHPPRADLSQQPARQLVVTAPPASPWLFPLDLPLELMVWLWRGQPPAQAAITLPPAPAAGSPEVRPKGEPELVERATAARIQR